MALLILTASAATATECPEHFAGGEAPVLRNEKLAPKARELCNIGFALLHSGLTRTALYAAEHLTRHRVRDAKGDERNDTFHEESRLPAQDRARLSDYARSGYDRGHLAPNGDMPEPESQHQSFSLANMIPQNPDNNRNLWRLIETATRDLALERGELYVVTGPIYQGSEVKALKGRVLIPTHIYKAILDPRTGEAAAYVTPNAPGRSHEEISIAALERRTGIEVFPLLPASSRQRAMDLPEPQEPKRPRSRTAAAQNEDQALADALAELLEWLLRKLGL
ncbi:DNA/RNA non-specific endonuclease [Indioceanicola profundi]|uniref:DNA/RNA non-specific endonuclease n=1 Tax=Indioceanicola profundi TaxID=2220096 RepID=UPI001CEDBBFF|nr:DNA/RNA non-specific endonuclease [Indioceanicola profundi]